jgi:molybdenum cofactor cytidylyltransferase
MIAGLIPACGQSRRMGRPKLVLPVRGQPLLGRVITAFLEGGAQRVLVVTAPASEPGAAQIAEIARTMGAEVLVAPKATPDMRSTVELGLERLRSGIPPEFVVMSPADAPGISAQAVSRVIEALKDRPNRIAVPVVEGRRAHPLGLPWRLASEIFDLPANVGVNALLRRYDGEIQEIAMDDRGLLEDVDTPEDYRRWSPD